MVTIGGFEQEVEDGTVVPDIEGTDVLELRDVADDPLDLGGALAETTLGHIEARLGDVEHGHTSSPRSSK